MMQWSPWKLVFATLVVALTILFIDWCSTVISRIPDSSEEALSLFFERQVAEDQLMDPLILAGDKVAPALEKMVLDSNMPRRRYAVGALGEIGEISSLLVLARLVRNKEEAEYLRCDAFVALSKIDRKTGTMIAREPEINTVSCISKEAKLVEKKYRKWADENSRTYFRALLGWHQ